MDPGAGYRGGCAAEAGSVTTAHPLVRRAAMFIALLFAAGCSPTPRTSVMGPSGILPILEASSDLERAVADGDLFVSGSPGRGALSITRHVGIDAIAFRSGRRAFAIGRSVDSLLINTPYVEWTWSDELAVDDKAASVAIAVGLADPATDDDRTDLADAAFGVELPAIDYLVVAARSRDPAGESAPSRSPERPRIGLVGLSGNETGPDEWSRDGIDLENLVRQLWPTADVYRLHVRYVAVIVPANRERQSRALLGELSLHR